MALQRKVNKFGQATQIVKDSSNNHTLNGVPLTDICDTLAGRYPKDFKFVGWHPHCRCHVVTVLKTEQEMQQDTQRILRGEDPLPPQNSENVVNNVPEAFNKWVAENAARTATSRALPYFIKDNYQYVQRDISIHKTGTHMTGRSTDREFSLLLNDTQVDVPAKLPQAIREDAKDFCNKFSIEMREFTWSEADSGIPNLNGHPDNCQSAVVAYEARRRGINVISLPHSEVRTSASWRLGENSGLAFVDKAGNTPNPITIQGAKSKIEAQLKKRLNQEGRYHIGMNITDTDGHILVAEKIKGHNVVFYDPSDGSTWSLGEILTKSKSIELLRVDNLKFNHEIVNCVCCIY